MASPRPFFRPLAVQPCGHDTTLLGGGARASSTNSFCAAPAGLAILDRELRYVQLNETLALMNGRPVADHLGKPLREVLPTIAATLEPLLQRILDTGEPALNIELSGETPAQPGVTRYWRGACVS